MIIGGDDNIELVATVDTSYAPSDVYSNDLKSIIGATKHLSTKTGSMVSLCNRHDYTIDSSMAAEDVGCHLLVKRLLPLRIFLGELGFDQINPTVIYMDNEPYLKAITGDRGASNKSKHIVIKLHIVREAYDAGHIVFKHMYITANIPLDGLAKLLPYQEYLEVYTVTISRIQS